MALERDAGRLRKWERPETTVEEKSQIWADPDAETKYWLAALWFRMAWPGAMAHPTDIHCYGLVTAVDIVRDRFFSTSATSGPPFKPRDLQTVKEGRLFVQHARKALEHNYPSAIMLHDDKDQLLAKGLAALVRVEEDVAIINDVLSTLTARLPFRNPATVLDEEIRQTWARAGVDLEASAIAFGAYSGSPRVACISEALNACGIDWDHERIVSYITGDRRAEWWSDHTAPAG